MRAGEVLALRRGDVTLAVGREALRVREGKNGGERVVILGPTATLRTLRGLRAHTKVGYAAAPFELLFRSRRGTAVSASGPRLTRGRRYGDLLASRNGLIKKGVVSSPSFCVAPGGPGLRRNAEVACSNMQCRLPIGRIVPDGDCVRSLLPARRADLVSLAAEEARPHRPHTIGERDGVVHPPRRAW